MISKKIKNSNYKLRHGINYEKDAVLMSIQSESAEERLDITGRGIVLAFRLLSIKPDFPSIVTGKDLIQRNDTRFIVWKPTNDEKLRFFKDEMYGVNQIRISGQKERVITDWAPRLGQCP